MKDKLLGWYDVHQRELPWRQTKDPYRIWVSEVILQQTRVVYGLDYYQRFLENFPDVNALATASEDDVMRCWQGLGYYRRAAHLHLAAKSIVERHGGVFPTTYNDVSALKGVGRYTAAAVCSIAYGLPYAAVDGNVYRVLSRLFGVEIPIDSGSGQRYFEELAQSLLDTERAGEFNQAMMDFGTLQCTPKSPNCDGCPFCEQCVAFLKNRVESYPVKEKRTKVRDRYFNYLRVVCDGKTVITKRTESDIWQNLYEFPIIESNREIDYQELVCTSEFRRLTQGVETVTLKNCVRMPKHQLSHQSIHATFYEMEWNVLPEMEGVSVVAEEALESYAISRLTENYLNKKQTHR